MGCGKIILPLYLAMERNAVQYPYEYTFLKHAEMKSKRCNWCGDDPLYVKYHDEEWGRLVEDDQKMFEFLVLESAQAGLSWITILCKRENYRKHESVSFQNFKQQIL
jgi:hypothetical protein